jgi:mono/diheme cytochrome c family protein
LISLSKTFHQRRGINFRRCLFFLEAALVFVACGFITTSARSAPGVPESPIDLSSGKAIYHSACIACHGADGKGAPEVVRGFKLPSQWPDFTDCSQTTSELNNDYRAVVTNGGPYRGFSQIMPAFRDALTPQQIDEVVKYVRTFCKNKNWPPGELNLPLALVTEKAYPEDEIVLNNSINATGAGGVTSHIIDEQRFGAKNQLEVDIPITFAQPQNQTWYGGVGDASFGVKRVVFSKLTSAEHLGAGSIVSLQGNIVVPTGDLAHGLGAGTTQFETFLEADHLFPTSTFLEFQGGAMLPTDTSKAPQNTFWYTTIGQMLEQGHGLGRIWSPMLEVLGSRDLVNQAKTDWDLVPEMQVTLSKRQHVRFGLGVRTPVNNTMGRPTQALFYLLWDWQEGSLFKGW